MNYERIGIRPGHGSTVAEIDGRDWLVDSSMLTLEPFELRRGERTERADPVHAIAADPHEGRWIIRWLWENGETMPCMVLEEGVPPERFAASYEETRPLRSPFNTAFLARRICRTAASCRFAARPSRGSIHPESAPRRGSKTMLAYSLRNSATRPRSSRVYHLTRSLLRPRG